MKVSVLFLALLIFFSSCKKSESSSNNGADNQWFFKCKVDNIDMNISGNGVNGAAMDANGNQTNNYFTGGSSNGYSPYLAINLGSNCNSVANSPCIQFITYFEYLANGTYTISNTNFNLLTSFFDIYPQNNSSITYANGMTGFVNTSASLKLILTHVGSVGENISGSFSGTIGKYSLSPRLTPQVLNISGSFNVYRSN
ncbi:MAG: hypothetical protein JST58_19390 [Bacteroidetes bacterium]|nr:hypothetical protein [Bacteroidota bacterium]